ncbi:uncharacterized protein K02A2.6-like [Dendronephthya gigantea]|uniref:uncharacterized protein K02A2.6-like n=1 Tax=Dendronephthya gigantea TaxID=151771 RepID=UPI00106A88C1|nr:uncharacterized protein K02A2.6-like [Dendronephthya gigantea]
MNEVRGPGEMDFTSPQNLSETWRRWRRGMEYYLTATCTGKTEAQKVAIFMCMIGKDGQEIKDMFELKTGEDGQAVITTAILFEKFEAHCKPKKNLVIERHRFITRDQTPGKSIDQYVTELRTLAASCKWGDLKDYLICSRIVSGILSRVVLARLLQKSDLKLNKAVELSRQQMKLFGSEMNHVNEEKSDEYLFLETVKVESVDQIRRIESEPVLSISACKELGLIRFISAVDRSNEETEVFTTRIKKEYQDVFSGNGFLQWPYHIELDPTVQPVIIPPRRIPFGLEARTKTALDEMCSLGVIVPVDQPTDWVNAMVLVEKKNTDKLQICIDLRPLNKAIKREHYHLPTIEEIITRLSGANAQEVFHKRLHELFYDLDGVETDIGDMLVWGKPVEHEERLEKVLQRARQSNLKLNPDKCKIRHTEVLYIGHVLTGDGIKPDASKLEAITDMPAPEDKYGIQRLLEMMDPSYFALRGEG